MAHDFAKKRNASNQNRKTPKGGKASKNHESSSHWSWFFSGLICGVFVAAIAYLGILHAPLNLKTNDTLLSNGPEAGASSEENDSNAEFEFYKYLQEAEVQVNVVPVDINPQAQDIADDKQLYLLQAGSFQDKDDAENRRVQVLLLNYQARIVPGNVSGKTWHRVQVGPFQGRSKAEQARNVLSSNNVDTIVLRMR